MEDNFKFEIVSPEKVIFSDNTTMVTLPSYEGDMSVLKNHISIITFLRPGKIKVKKNDGNFDEFFVEDGLTGEGKYDVLCCSGSLNIKVPDWENYLKESISWLFNRSKKALAFNLLSIEAKNQYIYYNSPHPYKFFQAFLLQLDLRHRGVAPITQKCPQK